MLPLRTGGYLGGLRGESFVVCRISPPVTAFDVTWVCLRLSFGRASYNFIKKFPVKIFFLINAQSGNIDDI